MSGLANTITVGVWIVAALPGLYLWFVNRREAVKDRRAAQRVAGTGSGAYRYAHFSVTLTNTFIAIEAVYVAIGIAALLRPPPQAVTDAQVATADVSITLTRLVTLLGLVGSSVVISVLAYRWRKVNAALVSEARKRAAKQ